MAYGVWRFTKRRLARLLAVLYPVAVTLTIVVTGNHFILDAIAGIAVMAFGFAVMGGLQAVRENGEGGGGGIIANATRGGAVR